MAVNGTALALVTGGGILIWSGLAGVTPLQLTKDLSAGKTAPGIKIGSPTSVIGHLLGDMVSGFASAIGRAIGGAVDGLNPFASDTSGGGAVVPAATGSSSALGAAIATGAQKYTGVPYKWAARPRPGGTAAGSSPTCCTTTWA
jgi:hypothetical protein